MIPDRETVIAEAVKRCEKEAKKSVARDLADNFPGYFRDIEAARDAIRYATGSKGNEKRAHLPEENWKPSTIAEGLAKLKAVPQVTETPLVVDCRRAMVLSDIHIPYHDDQALEIALEYGKSQDPDCIVLNGDMVDFYDCSDFDKDPRAVPLYREIEMANGFLDVLQKEFPDAKIVFKYGNHEDRLARYIRKNAAAVDGMKGVNVHEQLGLDARGIEWRKYEAILLGRLSVLHGHERKTPFNNAVNPAITMFRWANESVLVGHHHQISEYVKPSLSGKVTGCYSTGCLCNLKPAYNYHALTWSHGFAMVEIGEDGAFAVSNKRIIDGKVF